MTARRHRSVVLVTPVLGLVLAAVLGATDAVAGSTGDEAAPSGALPAAATGPAAQGPDASASMTASVVAPRAWLRDTGKPAAKGEAPAEPAHAPWRAMGVLAVLSGLGVAALSARKRRPRSIALPDSATRVRVLSSARVGPKASAVVAEVGGRVMLLGVTDTSVARLAWLDRETELPSERAPRERGASAVAPVELAREPSRAPVETADADEPVHSRSMATRFGEVLDRALGVRPAAREEFRANPGVAALLAADVHDVVATPRRPRVTSQLSTARTQIMEDQVAGLAQRRRRA